ncbi:hypothetical protein ANN_27784 [Periplaneta americana]|uniref:Gag-like protein n=1 Tax=Periplaneta americana TaxID=6978 RepID=A0ABQ8RV77_PERAM|nr:hypothetical protein ANN_27784 [Periplaneta americana]
MTHKNQTNSKRNKPKTPTSTSQDKAKPNLQESSTFTPDRMTPKDLDTIIEEQDKTNSAVNSKTPLTIPYYNHNDTPPYTVIMQAREGNITKLHPLQMGKLLFQSKIMGLQIVKKIGYNKLEMTFDSYFRANQFISSKFPEHNNVHCYIPTYNIIVKGIVKGISTDITEEEIKNFGKATGNIPILHVHRFQKRIIGEDHNTEYIPTTTIAITFRAKYIQNHFFLFYNRYQIQKYNMSIIQCRNCYKFGHVTKFCRNRLTCPKCSGSHKFTECTSENIRCPKCTLSHMATDDKTDGA